MQREHLIPMGGMAEPFSALSHFILAAAVLATGLWIIRRARMARMPAGRQLCLWVYVITAFGLFLVSATYHSLSIHDPLRDLFWRLDHAAIWIGIIGSFTGLVGALLPYTLKLLVPLWIIACLGASAELLILDDLPPWVSPILYILWGWANVPWLVILAKHHGKRPALLLFGGGLATIGGLMDSVQTPVVVPGVVEAHELLHLCVATGHFLYWWEISKGADGSLYPAASPTWALQPAT